MFGIIGSIWIILFKIKLLEIRLILWTAVGWGVSTMGIVYLAEGAYGQNWRFLVFATFLAYPLYIIDRLINDNQSVKVSPDRVN
jgi:hypothetical protein